MIGGDNMDEKRTNSTEWFDPKMNRWYFGPEMITTRRGDDLAVVNDNLVFALGGFDDDETFQSVLELSSELRWWKPSVNMLVEREFLGVGVINHNLYVISNVELCVYLLFLL